jgi:hypothetical protein
MINYIKDIYININCFFYLLINTFLIIPKIYICFNILVEQVDINLVDKLQVVHIAKVDKLLVGMRLVGKLLVGMLLVRCCSLVDIVGDTLIQLGILQQRLL